MATQSTKKQTATKQDVRGDFRDALGRGFFLRLTVGSLGIRRKVDKDKVEGLQDQEQAGMISVTKKILECEEYQETQRVYGKMKTLLMLRSVPVLSDMMKSCYLIPIKVWKGTWSELKTLRDEYDAAADAFVKVYSKAKTEAMTKLGEKFYNEADYPPVTEVRQAFYTRVMVFGLEVPGRLRDEDPLAFEAATKEMEETYRRTTEEAKLLLRQTMRDLVGHLAERLSGSGKGDKPKVFRDTAITHVTQFLEYVEPRDINNDQELQALAGQVRTMMSGVDVKQLRDDQKYRADMAKGLVAVTSALNTLLIEKPTRQIRVTKKGKS